MEWEKNKKKKMQRALAVMLALCGMGFYGSVDVEAAQTYTVYGSVQDTYGGNSDAVAIGTSSLADYDSAAYGYYARASAPWTTAVGSSSAASAKYAVALGNSASASSQSATALGYSSSASGTSAISIGDSAASGNYSMASGYSAEAYGAYSIALGYDATAGTSSTAASTAMAATAVGSSAQATSTYSTALGYSSSATGTYAISIGDSTASNSQAIAIGRYASAGGVNSVAIGGSADSSSYTTASQSYATAVGYLAKATGTYSTAWGYYSTASGSYSYAYGYNSKSSGESAIALGSNTTSQSVFGVAIGSGATVSGTGSARAIAIGSATASNAQAIAIGQNAAASGVGSVAIGGNSASSSGATASNTSAVAVGDLSKASNTYATALGYSSAASGSYSISLGDSVASGNHSMASGYSAEAYGAYSIALGYDATAGTSSTAASTAMSATAVGSSATASNTYASAFGYSAKASGNSSFAGGANTTASGTDAVAIGGSSGAGGGATASGDYAVAFGYGSVGSGTDSVAAGESSKSYGKGSVAVGYLANAGTDSTAKTTDMYATALGWSSSASGTYSISLGDSTASSSQAIAIGRYASSGGTNSIAIGGNGTSGAGAVASGNSAIAVGDSSKTYGGYSMAVGYSATVGTSSAAVNYATAVGAYATATGLHSLAISAANSSQYGAAASGNSSVAMGNNAKAYGMSSMALGHDSVAGTSSTATSASMAAIAIGSNASATATQAIAEGQNAAASGVNSVAIGGNSSSGSGATSSGASAVAVGNTSKSYGKGSIAIGLSSTAGKDSTETGTDMYATAVGSSAAASDTYATALGYSSSASGIYSISLGDSAADGKYAIAEGSNAKASGNYSVAIGGGDTNDLTIADGGSSVAVGRDARAYGGGAIALGFYSAAGATGTSSATNTFATALGSSAKALGTNATALGYSSSASAGDSISIGDSAAVATNAIAIGKSAAAGLSTTSEGTTTTTGASAVALGDSATASKDYSMALGYSASATADYSISLGDSSASNTQAIAAGRYASAEGVNSVAIGGTDDATNNTKATGLKSTAVGSYAQAVNTEAVAIGYDTYASGSHSLVIGDYSDATEQRAIAIGCSATANSQYATALGASAKGLSSYATALGYSAEASGDYAVAISDATAEAADTIAIGRAANASVANTIAIGQGASAGAANAVALGQGATVTHANSVALGDGSVTKEADSVSVGASTSQTRTITNVTAGDSSKDAAIWDQIAATGKTVELSTATRDTVGTKTVQKNQIATNDGTVLATFSKMTAVAENDTGFVSGDDLYTENRKDIASTNYIAKTSTAGANLSALDAKIGAAKTYSTAIYAATDDVETQIYKVAENSLKAGQTVTLSETARSESDVSKQNTIVSNAGTVLATFTPSTVDSVLASATTQDNGFVSGDVLYDYTAPVVSGTADATTGVTGSLNYISTSKNVGTNLGILDAKIGTITDTNTTYAKQANTVSKNLEILDKAITDGDFIIGDGTSHWLDVKWNGAADSSTVTRGTNSAAYGYTASASAEGATALGYGAEANKEYAVAVGDASASGSQAVSIGKYSSASGANAVAIGGGPSAGNGATASGSSAISLGVFSKATGNYAIAQGYTSTAAGTQSVAIGYLATAGNSSAGATTEMAATAVGSRANATQKYATALGYGAVAKGESAVSIGAGLTEAADAIAIGRAAGASVANAIAIGQGAKAGGTNAVALGQGATANSANSVALGDGSVTSEADSVSVGASTSATRTITNVKAGDSTKDAAIWDQIAKNAQTVNLSSNARDANDATAGKNNEIVANDGTVLATFTEMGSVSSGDTGFVSGGDLYNEVRPSSGNYISDQATKTNLSALDVAIGKTADGHYIVAEDGTATANVAANLTKLDTALYEHSKLVKTNKTESAAATKILVGSDTDFDTVTEISVAKADGTSTRKITGVTAGSANTDAANVGQLLKVDTYTLDSANASKVLKTNADGNGPTIAISVGSITSASTGFVDGATVYAYDKPVAKDGYSLTNVNETASTGTNLGLLDAAIVDQQRLIKNDSTNKKIVIAGDATLDASDTVTISNSNSGTRKLSGVTYGADNHDAAAFGQLIKETTAATAATANDVQTATLKFNDSTLSDLTIAVAGEGAVADGDKRLISGATLYNENRKNVSGTYIANTNDVGTNLSALDAKIGTIDDNQTTTVKQNKTVAENLMALDAAQTGLISLEDLTGGGTELHIGNGISDAVKGATNINLASRTGATRSVSNLTYGSDNNDAAAYGQLVKNKEYTFDTSTGIATIETNDSTDSAKKTAFTLKLASNGEVAKTDAGLISGEKVYAEVRPANGNYVKTTQTTATNLTALDSAIGNVTDNGNYITKSLKEDGTLQTSVAANLSALDTKIGAAKAGTNYAKTDDVETQIYKVDQKGVLAGQTFTLDSTATGKIADIKANDGTTSLAKVTVSVGSITETNTGFVDGATVYAYDKPVAKDGYSLTNVVETASTGTNLGLLDAAIVDQQRLIKNDSTNKKIVIAGDATLDASDTVTISDSNSGTRKLSGVTYGTDNHDAAAFGQLIKETTAATAATAGDVQTATLKFNDSTLSDLTIAVAGEGAVADGDKRLISGATLYTETRPVTSTNYISNANTTAANLSALDAAIGKTTNGHYIVAEDGTATANVAANLTKLDTALYEHSKLVKTNKTESAAATKILVGSDTDFDTVTEISVAKADGTTTRKISGVTAGSANTDAANVGQLLKVDTYTLDSANASKVLKTNADGNGPTVAISVGTITNASTGFIDGKTVYAYDKPVAKDGYSLTNVNETASTGTNLGLLDAAIIDQQRLIKNDSTNKKIVIAGDATLDASDTVTISDSNSGTRKISGVTYGADNHDAAAYGQLVKNKEYTFDTSTGVATIETNDSTDNAKKTAFTLKLASNGEVAKTDAGLISGEKVYAEVRPANGNYVKTTQTTATNLTALDSAIGNVADNGNYITKSLKEDGTLQTSVAANLSALDTKLGAAKAGTNYAKTDDVETQIYKVDQKGVQAGQTFTLDSTAMGKVADIKANDGTTSLAKVTVSVGTITNASTGFIDGKTVYAYDKPVAKDGYDLTNVNETASTGTNLGLLDAAIVDQQRLIKNDSTNKKIVIAGDATLDASDTVTISTSNSATRKLSGVTYGSDNHDAAAFGQLIKETTNATSGGDATKAQTATLKFNDSTLSDLTIAVAGEGAVADGDKRLISGATLYDENRKNVSGTYIDKTKDVGTNLSALDAKIGTIDDTETTTVKQSNTVSENLMALDAAQTGLISIEGLTAGGNEIHIGYGTSTAIQNATTINLATRSGATRTVSNLTYGKDNHDAAAFGQLIKETTAATAATASDVQTAKLKFNDSTLSDLSIAVAGEGTVTSGDKRLVSGGTLYTETRPVSSKNYISENNTTAANLSALDKKVGAAKGGTNYAATDTVEEQIYKVDQKAAKEKQTIYAATSTDTAKDNVIYANDGTTALATFSLSTAQSLSATDTGFVSGSVLYNELRPVTSKNYISEGNTTAANLSALDAQIGKLVDQDYDTIDADATVSENLVLLNNAIYNRNNLITYSDSTGLIHIGGGISGGSVSFADSAGAPRVLSAVAAGSAGTDAANITQLKNYGIKGGDYHITADDPNARTAMVANADGSDAFRLTVYASATMYYTGDGATVGIRDDLETGDVIIYAKTGDVTKDAKSLVTGGTVYDEFQKRVGEMTDGNYISKDKNVSGNLSELDSALKKVSDRANADVSQIHKEISVTEDGNYIEKDNTAAENITALDDAIGQVTNDGNVIEKSLDENGDLKTTVSENLEKIDAKIGKITDSSVKYIAQDGTISDNLVALANAITTGVTPDIDHIKDITKSDGATASGDNSLALGNSSHAEGESSISFGTNATATAEKTVSIGNGASSSAANAVAIGSSATVSGENSVSIGNGSTVSGTDSIAVGTGHSVHGNNSGTFGDPSEIHGNNSYALGNTNVIGDHDAGDGALGNNSFIVGNNSIVTGDHTFVLGNNVTTSANHSVVLGDGSTAKEDNVVSVGDEGSERRIVNVAAGVKDTDAVNVSQLRAQLGGNVEALRSELTTDIRAVAAGAAALAALHPGTYDPDDKLSFAVGYGHYRDANAGAIGAFYKPNEDVLVSVAGTIGNGNPMVNLGLSFKLGERGKSSKGIYRSNVELVNEVNRLRKDNENLKKDNEAQAKKIDALEADNAQMKKDNAMQQKEISDLKADNEKMKAQIAMILEKMDLSDSVSKTIVK